MIFTATMAVRYKYLDGNRYAKVFDNYFFFAAAYTMENKSLAGQGLRDFIINFGVMDRLVCNRPKKHTSKGTYFMKEVRKHKIDLHVTYPYCHNQSEIEGVIREMCKKWFRVILRKKFSHILWDYGLTWVAEIM